MKYDINDIDETVSHYFDALKDCKPLSKEEEHELLYKYKFGNDVSARNRVLSSNLRYANKIASAYRNHGISYSDLIEEANLGLIEAIDDFDLSRDVKVISYAKWKMIQRMEEIIKRKNRIATSELPEEKDTPFSLEEELQMAAPSNPKEEQFLIEPEINENNAEVEKFVKDLLSVLDEREIEIIKMRYGFGTKTKKTLASIGKKYNLTKERVRQIHDNALLKIKSRAMMTENNYLSR